MAGKAWSEEEVEFLKNNFENMSCEEISKQLVGRTKRAVQHMFRILKLERKEMQVGEKINRLTLIEKFIKHKYNQNITYGKFQCECGKYTEAKLTAVANNDTKSCGCLRDEKVRERIIKQSTRHGLVTHRLYSIFSGMKTRCYNNKQISYQSYGAKGITICDEWLNDFKTFYDWAMANGYQDNLSINRIDNNKGYYPENCEWATKEDQSNNTGRNVMITAWGETKNAKTWEKDERFKCNSFKTIIWRVDNGWVPELAISTPAVQRRKYVS